MNEYNAARFFQNFDDIMKSLKIPYMLFFGTALGAYRDNEFIKIDKDMDFAILDEHFKWKKIDEALKNKGFRTEIIDHRHKAKWDGSVFAVKAYKYNEKADIISLIKQGENRISVGHINKTTFIESCDILENPIEKTFYGRIVKLPPEKYYKRTYGKNWNVPDLKYTHTEGRGGNIIKK